jgi:hypothetical protein
MSHSMDPEENPSNPRPIGEGLPIKLADIVTKTPQESLPEPFYRHHKESCSLPNADVMLTYADVCCLLIKLSCHAAEWRHFFIYLFSNTRQLQ